jgi:hypothetical protein
MCVLSTTCTSLMCVMLPVMCNVMIVMSIN